MIVSKAKGKIRRGFIATCKCNTCGSVFRRKHGEAKKTQKHYCCNECLSESRRGKKNNFYGIIFPHVLTGKTGKDNPHWKGGKHTNSKGYILVFVQNHPYSHNNYILKHRLVMEKAIGRYLKSEEVVHHASGDKADNRLENLMLFNNGSKHTKYHGKLKHGVELERVALSKTGSHRPEVQLLRYSTNN